MTPLASLSIKKTTQLCFFHVVIQSAGIPTRKPQGIVLAFPNKYPGGLTVKDTGFLELTLASMAARLDVYWHTSCWTPARS